MQTNTRESASDSEVPHTLLEKIDYVDHRFPKPDALDEKFMKKLLFTKFKHWEYEQEYRAYVQLDEQIDGLYYADISNQLSLKSVIVGDQSKITRAQVSDALGKLGKSVEVFKARPAFRTFEVVRNRNEAKWA